MKNVLIVSGERSGESYGAELIKEIKKRIPEISFFGIGGEEMEREGAELLFRIDELSIIGIFEALPHLFRIYKIMKKLILE